MRSLVFFAKYLSFAYFIIVFVFVVLQDNNLLFHTMSRPTLRHEASFIICQKKKLKFLACHCHSSVHHIHTLGDLAQSDFLHQLFRTGKSMGQLTCTVFVYVFQIFFLQMVHLTHVRQKNKVLTYPRLLDASYPIPCFCSY